MKLQLLLIGSVIFSFFIGCGTDSNSNTILVKSDSAKIEQPCTLSNKIEYASFKYFYSDLFKTGKIFTPHLTFSADTIIHYKNKKRQVTLKYFDIRKNIVFAFGALSTSNTSVLLFTKGKQLHTLEVKGVGSFEFIGFKENKMYFRFSMSNCITYFSLGLNQSDIPITEYTVFSE